MRFYLGLILVIAGFVWASQIQTLPKSNQVPVDCMCIGNAPAPSRVQ